MNQQNDSNCLTNPRVMITHNVLSHMMAPKKTRGGKHRWSFSDKTFLNFFLTSKLRIIIYAKPLPPEGVIKHATS